MTPIGHSLVGAAIGTAAAASLESGRARRATIVAMTLIANLPDWPLPGWGHSQYAVSHSVVVGVLLVVVAAGLLPSRWKHFGRWEFLLGGALALFSHYLLDSFYNHGKGIAIFWPLSDARLILPIPWFETMTLRPLFSSHNVRVWAAELTVYGAIFVATWLLAHYVRRNHSGR